MAAGSSTDAPQQAIKTSQIEALSVVHQEFALTEKNLFKHNHPRHAPQVNQNDQFAGSRLHHPQHRHHLKVNMSQNRTFWMSYPSAMQPISPARN